MWRNVFINDTIELLLYLLFLMILFQDFKLVKVKMSTAQNKKQFLNSFLCIISI